MKRAAWWNPNLGLVSFCVALLVLHAALQKLLARGDVVSCIFAAGRHVPGWMLACAAAFVAVRLAAFFLIPALLAWRAVSALVHWSLVWRGKTSVSRLDM